MSQYAVLICRASLTMQAMCLHDQRPGDVLVQTIATGAARASFYIQTQVRVRSGLLKC